MCYVERFGALILAFGYDARKNMVCIRKTLISGAALACRRVGSKRVKSLSSCTTQFYKNNILFRQEVLLINRTFVLTSYMLCCLYNVGGRAYDDIAYLDPCDFYNDVFV